jgi:hypothetical protein
MRRLTLLLLATAGCGAPAAPAPPPVPAPAPAADRPLDASQRVENPAYTRWAKASPGTAAVYDEVTDVAGSATPGGCVYRLVTRTDAAAEVETEGWTKTAAGGKTAVQAQTLKQYRWMTKPGGAAAEDPGRPAGTYADGTETITVHGKEYATRWYKAKGRVEAGETDTQTWYSADVPGGLVRSVHRIPAIKKTVTMELVEVRQP